MKFKIILFLLFFTALCQVGMTQRVQSQLDSTVFLIGDQSKLTVQGTLPVGAQEFAVSKATLDTMKAIEFVSQSPIYKEEVGGNTIFRRELIIAFFDTGAYYIPSIPVTYTIGQKTQTLLTSPIPITVRTIASDSVFVAPIKPIIKEPWKIWDAWPIVAAIAAVFLLLGLIFYRRKKRQGELEIIEIPKTPMELALMELNTLEKEKFVQKGKLKEHYTQLSFILRSYLERQFEFPALESTTREIGYSLDQANFEPDTRDEIIQQLQEIDLIKFAKVQPDIDKVEHVLEELRNQILQLNQLIVTSAELDINDEGEDEK